ncbi:hypothetical protein PQI66_09930 [Corynebacterium sp. USCH3]|uniref:hypothetical protein n=1 Tax=Corynebacterium sp. USCH3 TaxID=3024840 RepID=UPI0030977D12
MPQPRYPAAPLRAAAQNIVDHYRDIGYAAEKCGVANNTMRRVLDPHTTTVGVRVARKIAGATDTPIPDPVPRVTSRQRVADQIIDIIEATGGVQQAAERTGMTPAQLGTIANHLDQRVPRQLADHIQSCHQKITGRNVA